MSGTAQVGSRITAARERLPVRSVAAFALASVTFSIGTLADVLSAWAPHSCGGRDVGSPDSDVPFSLRLAWPDRTTSAWNTLSHLHYRHICLLTLPKSRCLRRNGKAVTYSGMLYDGAVGQKHLPDTVMWRASRLHTCSPMPVMDKYSILGPHSDSTLPSTI